VLLLLLLQLRISHSSVAAAAVKTKVIRGCLIEQHSTKGVLAVHVGTSGAAELLNPTLEDL
jgi:hypothetical protein